MKITIVAFLFFVTGFLSFAHGSELSEGLTEDQAEVLQNPMQFMPQEASVAPKQVNVGISDVYIPAGFDSRTDAYVVVSGVFQNSCYSWSHAEIEHPSSSEHLVTTYGTVKPGPCMMVLVPYQKEVRLGTLASGQHTVRFVGADTTYVEKTFTVE